MGARLLLPRSGDPVELQPRVRVQVPQSGPMAYMESELGVVSEDVWDHISWMSPTAWDDGQGQASVMDLWSTPGWWQL